MDLLKEKKWFRNSMQNLLVIKKTIFIILMSMCASCNAYIDINISKHSPSYLKETQQIKQKQTLGADMNITIDIAQYFIQYVEDLLGIEGVHGLIDKIQLEKYLDDLECINNVEVRTTNGLNTKSPYDSILLKFSTTNLVSVLDSLKIPYSITQQENFQQMELAISRVFIVNILNSFSEIRDNNLISIFLPDSKTVPQEQFTKYIAWAFSEYQTESKIEQSLENSTIVFVMQKGKNITAPLPDPMWKIKTNNTISNKQTQQQHFISLLYTDAKKLIFTY